MHELFAGPRPAREPALCICISGHSMHVGAAFDTAESGIDLVSIMHDGGWKSPNLVVRYTQQISLQKIRHGADACEVAGPPELRAGRSFGL